MSKTITKIEASEKLKKKLKVAAYARVSSGKDAMLHSLSAQVSYYSRMIQNNADWEFVKVYADEAVSGTKDTRADFQRMMNDCMAGKIDLVITKSISRFARNIVTLLSTVRKLKERGVDVYFEEQNIHTISSEGELILTCLASMAQEEARSTSENMKWRIKQDFKDGIGWGYRHCLGYAVKDRKYIVIPEEARLVRYIFKLYLGGYGYQKIANVLNSEGYVSIYGNAFSMQAVREVITNISYTGNLILQKTYRTDYLTKKEKVNRGERDMYFCEDTHEAIISMDDFLKARKIWEDRMKKMAVMNVRREKYSLTGIVKCGVCGERYKHKVSGGREFWRCGTFDSKGKAACPAKQVTQEQLEKAICSALGIMEYTDSALKQIDSIVVRPGYMLEINMANGAMVTVKYVNVKNWTPEKREMARQKALHQNRNNRGFASGKKSNDNSVND